MYLENLERFSIIDFDFQRSELARSIENPERFKYTAGRIQITELLLYRWAPV